MHITEQMQFYGKGFAAIPGNLYIELVHDKQSIFPGP
jgi:hypothetical protein